MEIGCSRLACHHAPLPSAPLGGTVPLGPLLVQDRLDLRRIQLGLPGLVDRRAEPIADEMLRASRHLSAAPSATCNPVPRTGSSSPSACNSRYARATVFGFTTSCFDSSRTEGTRSPGRNTPAATANFTRSAICP